MTKKSKVSGLGIALGAGLGAALGVAAGHIALWLAIGLAIGVAIGIVLGTTSRRNQTDCPQCAEIHEDHEARVEVSRS